jgi:proteasome lid subunit RPN8/RPN11
MPVEINSYLLKEIRVHGENAYPEEACGLLLGHRIDDRKFVTDVIKVTNIREEGDRHNRYLLSPQEYLSGELLAEQRGLQVIGVFHSHPDHPAYPSEIDRESALPGIFYLITSVSNNKISPDISALRHFDANASRAWRLAENHRYFIEEQIYEDCE